MERAGTDGPDELDADLAELETLEREIAALDGELAAIDGTAPESGERPEG
jgi:hypothetical protein